MGTSASNVKNITLSQEDDTTGSPRPWSSASTKMRNTKSRHRELEVHELKIQLSRCKESLDSSEKAKIEAEKRMKEMELQIASLESCKLDLQDQIQGLEERLDQFQTNSILTDPTLNCQETVEAKNHYINQLENEIKTMTLENSKLQTRLKKKIKVLNRQVMEAKQESSLRSMEMKEEISKLYEENNALTEKLNNGGAEPQLNMMGAEFRPTTPGGTVESNSRTQLIVELSNKVSEQEDIIRILENKLAEKKKIEEYNYRDVLHSKNVESFDKAKLYNSERSPETVDMSLKYNPTSTFLTEADDSISDKPNNIEFKHKPRPPRSQKRWDNPECSCSESPIFNKDDKHEKDIAKSSRKKRGLVNCLRERQQNRTDDILVESHDILDLSIGGATNLTFPQPLSIGST